MVIDSFTLKFSLIISLIYSGLIYCPTITSRDNIFPSYGRNSKGYSFGLVGSLIGQANQTVMGSFAGLVNPMTTYGLQA